MVDKGTNEWDGDVGEERDDYEPDYDAVNDRKKLEEEQQQQDKEDALQSALDDWGGRTNEHDCCRGDCK